MDQKKITKLRKRLAKLRGSDVRPQELIRLVEAVGRREANRGKHPTYIGGPPGTTPISIPSHPTVNRFTAGGILDQIEQDLDFLEEQITRNQQ